MQYFTLRQKENIPNMVRLFIRPDSPDEPRTEFLKDVKDTMKQVTTISVRSNENNVYPDIFDTPVFIVSDNMKTIISMYDDTPIWKTVMLADRKQDIHTVYWMPLLDKLECLSDETEFYKDGSLRKMVLDEDQIGTQKIFRVASIKEKIIVINLDIAESMLRRFCTGVEIERVESKGGHVICLESKQW